jgi:polyphosphate kinase
MWSIEDPRLRSRIVDGILGVTLADNAKARVLQSDGAYLRVPSPTAGEPLIRSQVEFQNMARELSTAEGIVPPALTLTARPAPTRSGTP